MTFGSGGKRVVDFGGDDESVYGAALQPDGKLVVVGGSDAQVAAVRLNPNGSLNSTFSGDGKKRFSWGPFSRASAVLVLRTAGSSSRASPGPRAATSRPPA